MENAHELTGKLLGTYRLEQIIGRGGSSVVYLAQQLRPQRQVAVKILLPDQPLGSHLHKQFLRRFEHEADIIARLEHEHIIQIFEYNEQYGYAYLVLPYISGGESAQTTEAAESPVTTTDGLVSHSSSSGARLRTRERGHSPRSETGKFSLAPKRGAGVERFWHCTYYAAVQPDARINHAQPSPWNARIHGSGDGKRRSGRPLH